MPLPPGFKPWPLCGTGKSRVQGLLPALGGTSTNNKIVCLNMVKIKAQLIRHRV